MLSLRQTAAYNRQLPIVKYLLDNGAATEVADVGARYVALFATFEFRRAKHGQGNRLTWLS